MRIILTTFLFGVLLIPVTPASLHAQSTVKGSVVDSTNGKPLEGVNVFISGTKVGTATDSLGNYRLRRIPVGTQKLVVSSIGYGKTTIKISITPDESRTMDFRLKPVVYQMPEIFVGNLDKHWHEYLERFTALFIGESTLADSVQILNPEVLRFEKHFLGPFRAMALAPLQIQNNALGYHITYYLDAFKHTGSRTQWDGEPFFTELEPADSAQAAYWQHNRRKAFYGSERHFFLALMQNRLNEQGFVLYKIQRNMYGASSHNRSHISGHGLIHKSDKIYTHKMNFFDRLEVVYTREKEELRYLHWKHNYRDPPAQVQISYLDLNQHPIHIDADGEIKEPYGATVSGHFAYERLADLTPREYRPDGFVDTTHTADGKDKR